MLVRSEIRNESSLTLAAVFWTRLLRLSNLLLCNCCCHKVKSFGTCSVKPEQSLPARSNDLQSAQ